MVNLILHFFVLVLRDTFLSSPVPYLPLMVDMARANTSYVSRETLTVVLGLAYHCPLLNVNVWLVQVKISDISTKTSIWGVLPYHARAILFVPWVALVSSRTVKTVLGNPRTTIVLLTNLIWETRLACIHNRGNARLSYHNAYALLGIKSPHFLLKTCSQSRQRIARPIYPRTEFMDHFLLRSI